MLESKFEKDFCARVREELGRNRCHTLKLTVSKGIPDRLILFNDRYAMLEFKRDANAKVQPGQPGWVRHLDNIAFARFVYPDNGEQVYKELMEYFKQ